MVLSLEQEGDPNLLLIMGAPQEVPLILGNSHMRSDYNFGKHPLFCVFAWVYKAPSKQSGLPQKEQTMS